MSLLYLLAGSLGALIGGAPLGASNIAVISATTQNRHRRANLISLGAAMGEVLLVVLALCYSRLLADILQMNPWIQAGFIAIFFLVGLGFLWAHRLPSTAWKARQWRSHPLGMGIFLAFVNPPVLVFWMVVVSLSSRVMLPLSDTLPWTELLLFLLGVGLGKFGILWAYGRFGRRFERKNGGDKTKLYRLIGIVLVLLSTLQGIRFLLA